MFCINTIPVFSGGNGDFLIAAGVVPHHLLAREIMVDFFEFVAEQEPNPDTVIILSPDHLNSAVLEKDTSFITVNWEKAHQKFCNISIDRSLLKKLSSKHNIKQSSDIVLSEFGITNLIPFIEKYLPQSNIVPILISEDTSQEEVEQLVNTMHKISPSNTMLIAIVDFSHYLPAGAAEFHDTKSIRVLLNFEEDEFKNIEVDSWQSLYAARLFAKLRESENHKIIAHKNSTDFIPHDLNSTTSYFSAVFQKGLAKDDIETETILFCGDIMLNRGMEELVKQNSVYYPFLNIVQFLRGVDIVFANLEGPVLKDPPLLPENELKFAFHSSMLKGIKWSKINLLSLANNHTSDMGKEGLEETRNWLEEYQIDFIGNPFSDYEGEQDLSFSTKNSVLLAFNRVLPLIHSQEKIIKEIKKVRKNNPKKCIIVSIHWGNEYQTKSSISQRDLARKIIEAGADMIIGHHPHVVQEIELIHGKPVFYSLGNFIFDEQSLPETKNGLLVGLAVEPEKFTFRLFQINNQLGQPKLMVQKEAKLFLKNLAQISDKSLWKNIKEGIIEINRIE
jgi:poly-gamma-glutamate synthesis protein (capsule biosynthesis protein)